MIMLPLPVLPDNAALSTDGHKNSLDFNRLVARNRYLFRCESTLSMATSRRSTSTLHWARRGLVSCLTADLGQGKNNEKAATHILLVADPQILDDRSYPERSSLLRTVSRIFVDMNLRKAWRVAKSKRPHAVIFLGDMMDNGFADMHITECVYRTLLAVLIPPPSSSSFPSLNSFPPLSPSL